MPSRVYQCGKCSKTRMIEWKVGGSPRCPCGSQNLLRVALPPSSPQAKAASVPVSPPVVKPVIPTAPSMAGYVPPTTSPPRPGAASLLQGILASKVGKLDPATGARYANRNTLDNDAYNRYWASALADLPPAAPVVANTQEAVSSFVRTVVDNCKVDRIPDRQVDLLFGGRKYLIRDRISIDLQLPLGDMAAGKCRPAEHANTNRSFGNAAQDLPATVGGEPVSYLEYGWRLRVPPRLKMVSRPRNGAAISYIEVTDANGNDVPFGTKTAIARRITQDGGTLEAGLRLVISSWGHLFYTDSHYRSFLIYDPSKEAWLPYGTRRDADVSWYTKGARNIDWVLPPSAPGYY